MYRCATPQDLTPNAKESLLWMLLLFRLVLVLYFIGFILGNNSEVEKCALMVNGTGVLIENYIYVVNDFCYSTEIYLCNWNFVTQGL